MRKEFEFEERRLVLDHVHTQKEFFDFIGSLQLREPFIVKPNWICADYGHFTDPKILEWTLKFLNKQGKVVLVEAYSARNMMALLDHIKPPCSRFSEDQIKLVRKTEEDFLKETGTKNVIDELGIEYINITEEVLENRTVDEETLKEFVEKKYPLVLRDELYDFLPEKLYELRKGTFISLAKFKVFFTMCTKNMFGLIPEHVGYDSRDTYHGKADKDLSQNIVDINKIYRSIFNVIGIVEGVNSLSLITDGKTGKYKTVFGYRYDVLENKGLIYYCDDPLWLDAFIHQQCGKDPMETEHLQKASKIFRKWPSELIEEAKKIENPLIER
ncbi:MAG: DUF362 domain-containing protein [Candidatus Hodarchaeota archaeon]